MHIYVYIYIFNIYTYIYIYIIYIYQLVPLLLYANLTRNLTQHRPCPLAGYLNPFLAEVNSDLGRDP